MPSAVVIASLESLAYLISIKWNFHFLQREIIFPLNSDSGNESPVEIRTTAGEKIESPLPPNTKRRWELHKAITERKGGKWH